MLIRFIIVLILFMFALWVYGDAKKRGKSSGVAFGWFVGVLLLPILFFPLWLIGRPTVLDQRDIVEKPKLCIHCGKYYEGDLSFCPNCGKRLKA